ncbi:MAG: hypothetical protein WA188_12740 [Terriglobales bacterium]
MRPIQRVGPYVDITEARDPLNPALVVKLGLRGDSFQQSVRSALATTIAQYYGIVQDGLLNAIHLFKGLKRPLMHGDDKEADKSVLVYSWRPEFDCVWTGSQFDGNAIRKTPPPNRVFVVLVREEKQPNAYEGVGSVLGSIEKWNWIKEDPALPHAPIDWQERYGTRLWSRSL